MDVAEIQIEPLICAIPDSVNTLDTILDGDLDAAIVHGYYQKHEELSDLMRDMLSKAVIRILCYKKVDRT